MSDAINLAALAATAATVAEQHSALTQAIGDETAAEAALLEAAIAAVRPALRALASKIIAREYHTSGRDGLHPVREQEYHPDLRGLVLVDDFCEEDDRTGNAGSYAGDRLVLLTTGELVRVKRTGHWSRWQGSDNEYTTTWRVLTPLEAARRYRVAECLATLDKRLASHLEGNAAKRTAAATQRAERLRAMATLAR